MFSDSLAHQSTPTIKQPAAEDEKHFKTPTHTSNPAIVFEIGGQIVTIFGKALLNGEDISGDFRGLSADFDDVDQATTLSIDGEVLTIHGKFLFNGREVRPDDEKNIYLCARTKIPPSRKFTVNTSSPNCITIEQEAKKVLNDGAYTTLTADEHVLYPPQVFSPVKTECANVNESDLGDQVKLTAMAMDLHRESSGAVVSDRDKQQAERSLAARAGEDPECQSNEQRVDESQECNPDSADEARKCSPILKRQISVVEEADAAEKAPKYAPEMLYTVRATEDMNPGGSPGRHLNMVLKTFGSSQCLSQTPVRTGLQEHHKMVEYITFSRQW